MIENLANKNLLLLEDNNEFIENIISLFNMFVKKTFIAKNIADAKKILEDETIDIIISDIHLKNENGLDFIKEIRASNQEIPIAILSGYKDESLLFRAMTLQLSGYLVKPINFKSLVTVLEDCAKKIVLQDLTLVSLKDNFVYNKNSKNISKENEIFELNKKEVLFFEMLCENKTKIITKDMIANIVYENETMSDSAVNNFISRLRKRFGKSFLHTIPDIGYKMIV
jgi:two-component system, OmpR family, response regulator VanR